MVGAPGYVLDGEPFWGQDRSSCSCARSKQPQPLSCRLRLRAGQRRHAILELAKDFFPVPLETGHALA